MTHVDVTDNNRAFNPNIKESSFLIAPYEIFSETDPHSVTEQVSTDKRILKKSPSPYHIMTV